MAKKVIVGLLAAALWTIAMAGPNENAKIVFDYDMRAGNQGITSIDAPGAGETLVFEVRVIGCNTLDSYSFQLRYFVPHLIFGELSLKNGIKENNILNQKGNYLLDAPIITVDSSRAVGVMTVSVVNTTDDPTKCPSGDGLLAKVTFYTKVNAPLSILFGDVVWKDPAGVTDLCKPQNKGELFLGGGSLPVELSSFTARYDGVGVVLRWVTETETNSWGFYVLRSTTTNGDYTPISDLIRAAGNSTTRREYQWRDIRVEDGKTYYYKLQQMDLNGSARFYGPVGVTITGKGAVPQAFRLHPNFPNPFNPGTIVRYDLPQEGDVRVEIYNLAGRLVRNLVDGNQPAGSYEIGWDGRDDAGAVLPAGAYFCRLTASGFQQSVKMMLLR